MKRGCITTFVMAITLYAIISAWDAYQSRPTALYERWFGEPVPSDVTNLKGESRFSLTESTHQLSFNCAQERIEVIRSHLGMSKIEPDGGWHGPGVTMDIEVNGRTYHTNWFDAGLCGFRGHLNEIQVYWKGHQPDDLIAGGYALYFVPSTGEAFYRSISN